MQVQVDAFTCLVVEPEDNPFGMIEKLKNIHIRQAVTRIFCQVNEICSNFSLKCPLINYCLILTTIDVGPILCIPFQAMHFIIT